MNIGDKIKEQRLKKEWTQEQLGQLLNVSRPTISSWEVGRNYPDLEMTVAISDLFGISLDELLRGDREMTKNFSKKLRWNRYYKIILAVIAVVVIVPASSLAKLHWDEHRYRENLAAHSWREDEDSRYPDGYLLNEGEIEYSVFITRVGWLPIPLPEYRPGVTAIKGDLMVHVNEGDQNSITVHDAPGKNRTYTDSIAVDDQANIIEEKDWSAEKKKAIETYIADHKTEYITLLKAAAEKRAEIVQ
ncbi:helix-turn-helix transcriptional regulator [Enterococcus sp. 669A]|uniref:Helix-turn-helix transcriptional regulator n=1 Tax=Candidatus Enterococcus moelleringii TaxID=2815325 RepID=A0ABS3L5V8_9ENTE|nr:helix-turn-helix transcriptional regulator [Enterococcus sp. 669A]